MKKKTITQIIESFPVFKNTTEITTLEDYLGQEFCKKLSLKIYKQLLKGGKK